MLTRIEEFASIRIFFAGLGPSTLTFLFERPWATQDRFCVGPAMDRVYNVIQCDSCIQATRVLSHSSSDESFFLSTVLPDFSPKCSPLECMSSFCRIYSLRPILIAVYDFGALLLHLTDIRFNEISPKAVFMSLEYAAKI